MDAIDQVWRRIEVGLRLHALLTESQLAAGASERAIEQLEGVLGVALPEDFRASYRRHDGGFTMRLASYMELLPLERIAETWQILEELLHDDEWARQPPYYFTEEVVRSG